MTVEVRRLSPDLVSKRLLAAIARPERWNADEADGLIGRALVHAQADDRFIGIAYLESAPVGAVEAQDYGTTLWRDFTVIRMHDVFVAPECRRQGIGRELVAAMLRWARSRPNAGFVEWQATREAVSFYESLGLTPDYVSDVPDYPYFVLDVRADRASASGTTHTTRASALDWL
jgi:GNAT superfamily N-acetyltransferase